MLNARSRPKKSSGGFSVREPPQIPAALGLTLSNVKRDQISSEKHHGPPEIMNCEYVASYNLMDDMSKRILIPGRPPLWTPTAHAVQLREDAGTYYRDLNSATFPEHPLEPAITSVLHLQPGYDTTTIDIAACGSTLGNLLRFVRGEGDGFSFIVQIIGQTAFFVRRETSPKAIIEGVYGFGNRFLELNTTWSQDVKGSSSHQRIITYDLGDIKMMVRFEADGYTFEQTDDFGDQAGGVPICRDSVDAITALLQGSESDQSVSGLTVLNKGASASQASIFDIKTRSRFKDPVAAQAEQLPRLWLRQIENLVLSFHSKGQFDPPRVQNVQAEIFEWEAENATPIVQLMNLIMLIKDAAKAADGGMIEVRKIDKDILEFRHLAMAADRAKWSAASPDLCRRWL